MAPFDLAQPTTRHPSVEPARAPLALPPGCRVVALGEVEATPHSAHRNSFVIGRPGVVCPPGEGNGRALWRGRMVWGRCISVGAAHLLCTWRGTRSARQGPTVRARTEDKVPVSARGDHMATSHQRTQRRADPSGASVINVNSSCSAVGVVVPHTLTHDDSARRRAEDLDAEAAYYRHRAIQEEQALGPGHYVNLLRDMATDQAAMAQRIRTGKRSDTTSAPGEAARRRLRQPASPFPPNHTPP